MWRLGELDARETNFIVKNAIPAVSGGLKGLSPGPKALARKGFGQGNAPRGPRLSTVRPFSTLQTGGCQGGIPRRPPPGRAARTCRCTAPQCFQLIPDPPQPRPRRQGDAPAVRRAKAGQAAGIGRDCPAPAIAATGARRGVTRTPPRKGRALRSFQGFLAPAVGIEPTTN